MSPSQARDVVVANAFQPVRLLGEQAFSRAAGAPLVAGNEVRILRDAEENFPAWLDAIGSAQSTIFFESYIISDDSVGRMFVEALAERARSGVQVRLLYDWMGTTGGRRLWSTLRAAGAEVRCFNPPRVDKPIGWLSRDHRKMITVDGRMGFVTGLCVSELWLGKPSRGKPPWRDTGLCLKGPAVAELEAAFADIWAAAGPPLDPALLVPSHSMAPMGDVALRVVASQPNLAGLFRLDQLIAAIARQRLWLTDAYFVGTVPYVQALCAAARDGVDVRLLVPGSSDIPVLSPLSRAGYRPLLEAGVRVFEWNGTMLHAKTAVADERWARVGSTNLNIASWLHNWELDVAVEDENFARAMATMYEADLDNATEIVLGRRNRLHAAAQDRRQWRPRTGGARRAAAGALSLGSVVSAALSDHRVLGPAEAKPLTAAGVALLIVALAGFFWPRALSLPIAVISAWLAISLLLRATRMLIAFRKSKGKGKGKRKRDTTGAAAVVKQPQRE